MISYSNVIRMLGPVSDTEYRESYLDAALEPTQRGYKLSEHYDYAGHVSTTMYSESTWIFIVLIDDTVVEMGTSLRDSGHISSMKIEFFNTFLIV